MADAVAIFTPGQRIVDTSGTPFASLVAYVYDAGTTTPKLVYSDAELATELGTAIYFDSAGYPVTSEGSTSTTLVYTGTDSYKIVFVNDGVTVVTHDNVKGAVISSTGSGESYLTQDAGDVRYMRNPNALASTTSLTSGDKIGYFNAAAAGNRYIDWDDLSTDLLGEWRTAGYVFSAGARVLFQAAPPTGWTLETSSSYNNVALRFTTGTPGTGGTVAFDTLFASQTFTGTVGNTTITTSTMPSHTHQVTIGLYDNESSTGEAAAAGGGLVENQPYTSGSAGSDGSHTHSLTMDAFSMAVKYASVNIGQKA